ncbi:expressed unknown protein [Seminavis robusta]|uniref:Uncharacterized protein n=1 Tax=Seminavis robusta TaxID=568900 RepID=A0A9N8EFT4_9STRA|nr:expressed unknown protein [Seminavis robusta]|eukprot:Sro1093_g240400.1 n/a (2162) ;mRNA; f:18718-25203
MSVNDKPDVGERKEEVEKADDLLRFQEELGSLWTVIDEEVVFVKEVGVGVISRASSTGDDARSNTSTTSVMGSWCLTELEEEETKDDATTEQANHSSDVNSNGADTTTGTTIDGKPGRTIKHVEDQSGRVEGSNNEVFEEVLVEDDEEIIEDDAVEEVVIEEQDEEELVEEEVEAEESEYADQVVERWNEVIEEQPEDLEAAVSGLIAVVYKDKDVDIENMLRRTRLPDLYKYLKSQYWYKIHTNQEEEASLAAKLKYEKPSELVSVDDMLKGRMESLIANVQRMDPSERRSSVVIPVDKNANESVRRESRMQNLIDTIQISSRNLVAKEKKVAGNSNNMLGSNREAEKDVNIVHKLLSEARDVKGSHHVAKYYEKAVNNRAQRYLPKSQPDGQGRSSPTPESENPVNGSSNDGCDEGAQAKQIEDYVHVQPDETSGEPDPLVASATEPNNLAEGTNTQGEAALAVPDSDESKKVVDVIGDHAAVAGNDAEVIREKEKHDTVEGRQNNDVVEDATGTTSDSKPRRIIEHVDAALHPLLVRPAVSPPSRYASPSAQSSKSYSPPPLLPPVLEQQLAAVTSAKRGLQGKAKAPTSQPRDQIISSGSSPTTVQNQQNHLTEEPLEKDRTHQPVDDPPPASPPGHAALPGNRTHTSGTETESTAGQQQSQGMEEAVKRRTQPTQIDNNVVATPPVPSSPIPVSDKAAGDKKPHHQNYNPSPASRSWLELEQNGTHDGSSPAVRTKSRPDNADTASLVKLHAESREPRANNNNSLPVDNATIASAAGEDTVASSQNFTASSSLNYTMTTSSAAASSSEQEKNLGLNGLYVGNHPPHEMVHTQSMSGSNHGIPKSMELTRQGGAHNLNNSTVGGTGLARQEGLHHLKAPPLPTQDIPPCATLPGGDSVGSSAAEPPLISNSKLRSLYGKSAPAVVKQPRGHPVIRPGGRGLRRDPVKQANAGMSHSHHHATRAGDIQPMRNMGAATHHVRSATTRGHWRGPPISVETRMYAEKANHYQKSQRLREMERNLQKELVKIKLEKERHQKQQQLAQLKRQLPEGKPKTAESDDDDLDFSHMGSELGDDSIVHSSSFRLMSKVLTNQRRPSDSSLDPSVGKGASGGARRRSSIMGKPVGADPAFRPSVSEPRASIPPKSGHGGPTTAARGRLGAVRRGLHNARSQHIMKATATIQQQSQRSGLSSITMGSDAIKEAVDKVTERPGLVRPRMVMLEKQLSTTSSIGYDSVSNRALDVSAHLAAESEAGNINPSSPEDASHLQSPADCASVSSANKSRTALDATSAVSPPTREDMEKKRQMRASVMVPPGTRRPSRRSISVTADATSVASSRISVAGPIPRRTSRTSNTSAGLRRRSTVGSVGGSISGSIGGDLQVQGRSNPLDPTIPVPKGVKEYYKKKLRQELEKKSGQGWDNILQVQNDIVMELACEMSKLDNEKQVQAQQQFPLQVQKNLSGAPDSAGHDDDANKPKQPQIPQQLLERLVPAGPHPDQRQSWVGSTSTTQVEVNSISETASIDAALRLALAESRQQQTSQPSPSSEAESMDAALRLAIDVSSQDSPLAITREDDQMDQALLVAIEESNRARAPQPSPQSTPHEKDRALEIALQMSLQEARENDRIRNAGQAYQELVDSPAAIEPQTPAQHTATSPALLVAIEESNRVRGPQPSSQSTSHEKDRALEIALQMSLQEASENDRIRSTGQTYQELADSPAATEPQTLEPQAASSAAYRASGPQPSSHEKDRALEIALQMSLQEARENDRIRNAGQTYQELADSASSAAYVVPPDDVEIADASTMEAAMKLSKETFDFEVSKRAGATQVEAVRNPAVASSRQNRQRTSTADSALDYSVSTGAQNDSFARNPSLGIPSELLEDGPSSVEASGRDEALSLAVALSKMNNRSADAAANSLSHDESLAYALEMSRRAPGAHGCMETPPDRPGQHSQHPRSADSQQQHPFNFQQAYQEQRTPQYPPAFPPSYLQPFQPPYPFQPQPYLQHPQYPPPMYAPPPMFQPLPYQVPPYQPYQPQPYPPPGYQPPMYPQYYQQPQQQPYFPPNQLPFRQNPSVGTNPLSGSFAQTLSASSFDTGAASSNYPPRSAGEDNDAALKLALALSAEDARNSNNRRREPRGTGGPVSSMAADDKSLALALELSRREAFQ